MTAWLLSKLPANWLAEFIGFLIETVLIVFMTWHYTSGYYKDKEAQDLAKAQAQAAAQYASLTQKYNDAASQLETEKAHTHVVYQTIEKQVPTIIHDPVYRNVCLSDDGVRLINAALANELPASSTGIAASAVPAASAASGNDGR